MEVLSVATELPTASTGYCVQAPSSHTSRIKMHSVLPISGIPSSQPAVADTVWQETRARAC